MNKTTSTSLIHATRIAAEVLDAAILTAGMPEPSSVSTTIGYSLAIGRHEQATLVFSGHEAFSDVEQWAEYLGVEWATSRNDEGIEFIDAHASLDGVSIKVSSNRRPAEHSAEQVRRIMLGEGGR